MQQATILSFFKPHSADVVNFQPKTSTDLPVRNSSPKPTTISKSAEAEIKELSDSERDSCSVTQSDLNSSAEGICDELVIPKQCPDAAIVRVHESHLLCLKNLTTTLLPVKYSDKFFAECVRDDMVGLLSRVLLWDSQPVGWIRCRLEPRHPASNDIYIQVVGILAPYRGLGLASALLRCILCPSNIRNHKVSSVYVHVWQANCDALQWYERQGFQRERLEESYYRRLKPAAAWIMRKTLPE